MFNLRYYMKIISLSLDGKLLDKNSKSARKLINYGELVDFYYTIVPSISDKVLDLREKVKVVGSGGVNKFFQLLNIYRKLKVAFGQYEFDVVTVQDPFELAILAYRLARKNKVGLNIQLHGDFFSNDTWRNSSWRNRYRYYIARGVLKKADSIRVVSARVKKSLVEKLNIVENKILVVPIYTDKSLRKRKVIRQTNENFTYLWIGRFVAEKNLRLLLKAFKKVVESEPKSFLRLVGEGVEKQAIKKLANDLGLLEKIDFRDWVENVDKEYQEADAYVLSSDSEGWGMVIVEAMRNFLPVVMTNVGCANELVMNNENGIVVPAGDRKALTVGMLRLQNKDLRRMYINNIRQSLENLLNKEETLALYKKSWEMAMK